MFRIKPIQMSVAAAAIALACFSANSVADPNQGSEGPGTPGQGEQGPGQGGPGDDKPGNENADASRAWVEYWLEYIANLDRQDWAHGDDAGEPGCGC